MKDSSYYLGNFLFVFWLILNLPPLIKSQCADNEPCFPPAVDVAKLPSFNITINSTCGTPAEDFCVSTDCSLNCDASKPQNAHPPSHVIDAYELVTYWKSKNFDEPVFIRIDFGTKLLLHQISITFQFEELPNSLYIERSQDNGKTYSVLAYYALRCNDTFNMPTATKYNGMHILCFGIDPTAIKKLVNYTPRRDDNVALEVLKGGIHRNYFLATNIKIVLHEIFKPSTFDPVVADKRKFYFAVRDVDVQAACYCNGMSNQCNSQNYGSCDCQKNTEGKNCELCQPLYNNRPWEFGKACETCDCNNHTSSCDYDATKGFGVCTNCGDNTVGDKCEKCDDGYYLNSSVPISSTKACVDCDCQTEGVLFGSTICNPITGECLCKSNVGGVRCDTCDDGYYGLSGSIMNGCKTCACSVFGTLGGSRVCDKVNGQCSCKDGFYGRTCSTCKAGFYGYPVGSPSECKECSCNPSGSLNMNCEVSGQCFCRSFYYGRQCEQIRISYYSPGVNQLQFSSRLATVSSPVASSYRWLNVTDSNGNTFFELGYFLKLGGDSTTEVTMLSYTIDVPAVADYEVFLQYMTDYTFSNVNMRLELLSVFSQYSCNNGSEQVVANVPSTLLANVVNTRTSQSFGSACLMGGQYKVDIWFPPNSAGRASTSAGIFVMNLLLLPKYEYSQRYLTANLNTKAEIQNYYKSASNLQGWAQVESQGAAYLAFLYGSLYLAALECQCDNSGSINPAVCNEYGGQCNCKQNVYGRTCSGCLPEHFDFTSGLGCSRCACDLIGSVNNTCDLQTGQCHCKPNVVGRTCNKCALNYYGIQSNVGCQRCDCSILYSTSSACDENGNCKCKTGVGKAKCTECAAGYYDLTITGCKTCICNPIGTAGNKCNPTTGSCNCKPLVMGARCDQCMVGYYGFSSDFPDTCLKCHCTGKTTDCDAAKEYYLLAVNTTFSTMFDNNLLEGWTTVNSKGEETGKAIWELAPEYAFKRGFMQLPDTGNFPEVFFSAPPSYLGNKRSSYMYFVTFDMTQKSDTNPQNTRPEGDIIIKGKESSYKLVMPFSKAPKVFQKFESYRIQFYEQLWYKDSVTGARPTNIEMIKTLSHLEYIYIRAKWTQNDNEFTGISNIHMQYSTYNITDVVDTSSLKVANNVEYCNCPNAFSGQYCQECSLGHTRDPPDGNAYDRCFVCKCNGHSSYCDKNNGTCFNCLHNTKGASCGTCKTGHYGVATNGLPNDCQTCTCPGGLFARNQFATECALDTDGQPTCTNCQTGYTGRRCEVCSDSYHGIPTHPLGKCEKCTCNNNIDPSAAGNCNTTTGECLRCLYETVGMNCQWCRAGYYGDALSRSCQACHCNTVGSTGSDCHNITGKCNCKPNVIGRTCDTCASITFNFQNGKGCEACNCHLQGSLNAECDLVTGKCSCKHRVIGDKCDRCAPGYYNLKEECLPCECNATFTMENTTCDAVTGQCLCRDSPLGGPYSGRTCSECSVNAIGTPPECELCHSPCYDNWQKYIENEATDITAMQHNVTNLLSKFGGMTYEHIETQLAWLNGNLTTAMNVYGGGNYNTSAKEQQFRQIEIHIVEFEGVLNRVEEQLDSSKDFFRNTVSSFNGTVQVNAEIPQPKNIPLIHIRVKRNVQLIPKSVNAAFVIKMAEGFIRTSGQNNVSGQYIYTTIQDQYNQIISANTSIAEASSKLSDALLELANAATERSRIDHFLDTQYKAAYATNEYELKKIHDIVASIMIMQNKSVTIHQAALETLKSAQMVISQATKDAQSRQSEAVAVSQSVSQMKIDALTLKGSVTKQQETAKDLKVKVDDVLLDVAKGIEILTQGIRDIAVTKNKTEEILALAYQIGNITMPITLQEIEELSRKIQNTVINEGVINATFVDAQAGLHSAQEVQHRSKTALDVSQATLKDIENIELALSQSSTLRSESLRMQAETDVMVNQILNITSEIERDFNTVNGQGGQTLSLLNTAIDRADSSKMCFVNAKAIVDNATHVSKEARTKAQEAYLLHQSNEQLIPQYADQINDMYTITSASHTQAQLAKESADQLLTDVTEAERLLTEYQNQNMELSRLESDTESLEAELNELLIKFDQARVKFSNCNRP